MEDDGVCYLQPQLAKDAVVGHASANEVARAGGTILQACVIERGSGGLAYNLGEPQNQDCLDRDERFLESFGSVIFGLTEDL